MEKRKTEELKRQTNETKDEDQKMWREEVKKRRRRGGEEQEKRSWRDRLMKTKEEDQKT